jgi:nucleotide-binding universal stress UspA family protein
MATPTRILVATDFSPSARVALRSAETLARLTGGALALAHVLEPLSARYTMLIEGFRTPDLEEVRRQAARKALEREAAGVRRRGLHAEMLVRSGKPWQELLRVARAWRADVICLGNSGRSPFNRLLLGSTAENLVRRSGVPVLVTRDLPLRRLDRVFLPVDFDAGARDAVGFAVRQLPARSQLEALYVLPPPSPLDPYHAPLNGGLEEDLRRDLRRLLREEGAARAEAGVALWANPTQEILRRAKLWHANLIVISTHGRRGLSRALLGSVAEKVVRYADRPVLVLPPVGRARLRARTGWWAASPQRRASLASEAGSGKPSLAATSRRLPALERSRLDARRRWAPQAHTGRGGPPGRRGSGHAAGKGKGRPG